MPGSDRKSVTPIHGKPDCQGAGGLVTDITGQRNAVADLLHDSQSRRRRLLDFIASLVVQQFVDAAKPRRE